MRLAQFAPEVLLCRWPILPPNDPPAARAHRGPRTLPGPEIAKAYGLNGAGHRFFVFEGVSPKDFRDCCRELLDELALAPRG